MKKPKPAEEHDFLGATAAYAGPGDLESSPLENLLDLRKKLVQRRRQFALDARKHSIVYMSRAIDIDRVQALIRSIDEAIHDERVSGGEGPASAERPATG